MTNTKSGFKVSIYTPTKCVMTDVLCSEVIIPSVVGIVDILPGHTHLITQIDLGALGLISKEGKNTHLFIEGGICKVLDNHVSVLTHSCDKISEFDYSELEKDLKEVSHDLNTKTLSDFEYLASSKRARLIREKISLRSTPSS